MVEKSRFPNVDVLLVDILVQVGDFVGFQAVHRPRLVFHPIRKGDEREKERVHSLGGWAHKDFSLYHAGGMHAVMVDLYDREALTARTRPEGETKIVV